MRNIDKIKELENKIKFLEDQNAGLQSQLMRYKKAVKTRDILLDEIKTDMAGQAQIDYMLRAYIIAMVQDMGGEFKVDKKRISDFMKEMPFMKTVPTDDQYIITIEEGEVVGKSETL